MQNPSKTKHGERALAFLVFHPGFVSQELLLSIFFSWDSLHTMLKSHKKPWSYMDKREHKEGKDKGKLIRKCLKTKCAYLLKVIRIINQKKTFYRQRISECSCTRKESFDITGTFLGIPVHVSNIYCVSEWKWYAPLWLEGSPARKVFEILIIKTGSKRTFQSGLRSIYKPYSGLGMTLSPAQIKKKVFVFMQKNFSLPTFLRYC